MFSKAAEPRPNRTHYTLLPTRTVSSLTSRVCLLCGSLPIASSPSVAQSPSTPCRWPTAQRLNGSASLGGEEFCVPNRVRRDPCPHFQDLARSSATQLNSQRISQTQSSSRRYDVHRYVTSAVTIQNHRHEHTKRACLFRLLDRELVLSQGLRPSLPTSRIWFDTSRWPSRTTNRLRPFQTRFWLDWSRCSVQS